MRRNFLSRNIVKILTALGALAVLIAVGVFSVYRMYFSGPISSEQQIWGVFGDFVGGVLNPLFALLAFFALLLTIIIQNRELSVSSQELQKSAKALAEQSRSIKLQNFESTFFQMVSLHNEIVSSMMIGDPNSADRGFVGRGCFEELYRKFKIYYSESNKNVGGRTASDKIEAGYQRFFEERQSYIGHYFRNLYTIIKFVDDKGPDKEKKQYTNIVRAQLSSYELALLFYNCLWHVGRRKFKALVEKYELLENMDEKLLVEAGAERPLYDEGAYGERESGTA